MPHRRPTAVALLALLAPLACGSPPTTPDSASPSPPSVPPGAAAWLRQAAVPFEHVDPAAGLDDLEPLRQVVGDARVVALGEATHGTREFFQMKHRILRFLVERMGFTAFAIEATWPEANRVDRFVRTGEGDPEVLLSGLYFWTWNTSEVLDMIRWMRAHADAGGDVGFYGFDMQFPGMAIHNVLRFVDAADASAAPEFRERLDCLARFANGPSGRFPSPRYADQPRAFRDACLQELRAAHAALLDRHDAYAAATSEADWARALRSARVAIQYEEMASRRASRDAAMAENAAWLLDQAGPGGKLVLWAHNFHVSTQSGAMGEALRRSLGRQMVVIGFAFAGGSFTAVRQTGSAFGELATFTAGEPLPASYEDHFRSAGLPRFMLDLRDRDLQAPDAQWLAGPRLLREIGCCYDPSAPDAYWHDVRLPQAYDAILYLKDTTASHVLPLRYPSAF